ncbi:MAG: sensor histidine kinase [Vibrio sp.]
MQLRRSLRIYFLAIMLLVGAMTILFMSGIAVSYFFSGMDMAVARSMRVQARTLAAEDYPVIQDDMIFATDWQMLPMPIQTHFSEFDLAPNQLAKHIDGIPLFEPPKAGLFVMKIVDNGKQLYAAIVLPPPSTHLAFEDDEVPHFYYIILTALGGLLLFSAALVMILRSVSTPVENLKDWAKSLNNQKLSEPLPHFHYSELNTLAAIIQTSFRTVQDSLDREKRFLGYTGHELRTPIAVMRTNAELLSKLVAKESDKDKQIAVLQRIERAAFTMTDLTETLLWLNRQQEQPLPTTTVALGELVSQIKQDLVYLLHDKSVNVVVLTDASTLELPAGLCRIVISNLIRNAFQHTYGGSVVIKQVGCQLIIDNHNHPRHEQAKALGFGLGLELTERLVKQYVWYYQNTTTEHGHSVTLRFCSDSPVS